MKVQDLDTVHRAATIAYQNANDAVDHADTALRLAKEARSASRNALDQIEALIRRVDAEARAAIATIVHVRFNTGQQAYNEFPLSEAEARETAEKHWTLLDWIAQAAEQSVDASHAHTFEVVRVEKVRSR